MAGAVTKKSETPVEREPGQGDDATFNERALREFRKLHPPRKLAPLEPEIYRRILDDLMTLAGTEPDLVAPPRRRFD